MGELAHKLSTLNMTAGRHKMDVVNDIINEVTRAGYSVVELNDQKPWGAYLRLDSTRADQFVYEFFPDLNPETARLGMAGAELSPKFLIVAPNERLSWQRHHRRTERWVFLTSGIYHRSSTEEPGETQRAEIGDNVQFDQGEHHRLNGLPDSFVVVAEIWQHTDRNRPSDENDIIRLHDDYQR